MKQKFKNFINKIKVFLSKQDWKLIGIISGCMVGAIGFFYIFGLFSQFIEYWSVMRFAGLNPEKYNIPEVSTGFLDCISATFSETGLKGVLALLGIVVIIALLNINRIEKWCKTNKRGFIRSKSNSHGSANELSFN